MSAQPTTPAQVQEFVGDHTHLIIQGNGTKIAPTSSDAVVLSLNKLRGIIEYQPDEYTFTAYAGTPLSEINTALNEHNQVMPFDPLFVRAGATLGGTIAANTSGSGRFRYGGIRDFILGVRFVDGTGRLVSGGGRVVKNAAGFDLPKFFVGSGGLYGALVEVTFKVFPRPAQYKTLRCHYPNRTAALDSISALRTVEMDAFDFEPTEADHWQVLIRLGGIADVLPDRIRHIAQILQQRTTLTATETIDGADEIALWEAINASAWANSIVKVPLTHHQIPALDDLLIGTRRYSAGGNVAWLAADDITTLEAHLKSLNLVGLCLGGEHGMRVLGNMPGQSLAQRVKQVLDPHGKFQEAYPYAAHH